MSLVENGTQDQECVHLAGILTINSLDTGTAKITLPRSGEGVILPKLRQQYTLVVLISLGVLLIVLSFQYEYFYSNFLFEH